MANASVRITANTSDYRRQMREVTQQMKQVSQEYSLASQKAKLLGNAKDQLKAKAQQLTQKIEAQKQKIQLNSQYTNRLTQDSQNLRTKQEQLKSKIADVEAAYKKSTQETGKNSEESQKLKAELDGLKSELNENQRALQNTETRLESAQRATEQATAELENMEIELRQVNTEINNFDLDRLATGLQNAGGKIESIGQKFLGITTAVAGVATVSVKTSADFESAMSNVKAISGATGEDFKALEAKAKEMGSSTSKSATESADALSYMALAGWDTSQMLGGIEPILRLSEAAGTDLARTSDLVTDSMSALGIEVKDLSGYLDICAQAQRKSNTTADAMLEAYIGCGGTMKNLKVSTQESATALGVLANRGKKGSEAGNALNAIMVNLTSGAGQAGVAMKKLGVSAYDSEGNFKGIKVVLDELNGKLKNCTNEQRDTYLAMIGGKTQLDTLNALLSGASEEWDTLSKEIGNSKGVLNEVAATMQDNLNGKITALKSALEGSAIAIGNTMLPTLKGLVEKIQGAVDKFNSLDKSQQENIVKFGLVAASIGPVLIVFGRLLSTIGKTIENYRKFKTLMLELQVMTKLTTVITAVKGAFASFGAVLMANPIILVVAAIAALVAGIMYLWKTNEGFRNAVTSIWQNIKTTVINICEGIKNGAINVWNELTKTASDVFNNIKNTVVEICQGIKNGAIDAWNGLTETVSTVFNTIKNIIQVAFMFIANLIKFQIQILLIPWMFIWKNFKDKLISIWDTIKTAVVTKVHSIINPVVEKFNSIRLQVENTTRELKEKVVSKIEELKEKAVTKIEELKKQFILKVQSINNSVVEKFNTIKLRVENTTRELKEKVVTKIEELKQQFILKVQSIINPVVQKFESIRTKTTSTIEKLKSKVISSVSNLKAKMVSMASSIVSPFVQKFDSIRNKVNSTMEKLKNTVQNALNKVKGFFNSCKLKLPNIKMPHISISGKFSINPPSAPKFGIKWYAQGGIMNNPQIFGMAGRTLLGGGEAGPEAILPLTQFYNRLNNMLDAKLNAISNNYNINIEVYNELDGDEIASKTTTKVVKNISRDNKNNRIKKGK